MKYLDYISENYLDILFCDQSPSVSHFDLKTKITKCILYGASIYFDVKKGIVYIVKEIN